MSGNKDSRRPMGDDGRKTNNSNHTPSVFREYAGRMADMLFRLHREHGGLATEFRELDGPTTRDTILRKVMRMMGEDPFVPAIVQAAAAEEAVPIHPAEVDEALAAGRVIKPVILYGDYMARVYPLDVTFCQPGAIDRITRTVTGTLAGEAKGGDADADE